MATVAETIKEITREHLLNNNGLLFAQCVRAVGWIGGTVPELTEEQGIVELPTSDVSNSGIVVGAALVGRRPIYVIRYQGFLWYNAANLVNYAAKSVNLWNVPCPIFIRAIAMEGGMGPIAGGMHHSMIMHMPGIEVFAPITPNEYKFAWEQFQTSSGPVLCSEHRSSFKNEEEMPTRLAKNPKAVIIAIGAARWSALQASEDYDVFHVCCLRPFYHAEIELLQERIKKCRRAIVVDSDYTVCGASEHIAYDLTLRTQIPVLAMGLDFRTAGFSKDTDNLTPDIRRVYDRLTVSYGNF